MRRIFLSFWTFLLPLLVMAQLQLPGTPDSWQYQLKPLPQAIILKTLPRPAQKTLQNGRAPQPLRAGYILPVRDNLPENGRWQMLPDGHFVWRLKIEVPGASALNLYLKNLHLKKGDRLFMYNTRQGQLRGAFSNLNNGKALGTAYLLGKSLTIELDAQEKYNTLPFEIAGVGNITDYPEKRLKDFGDAGACEVPVNCPEGQRYKNQKNSVARILLRDGGSLFWCTGSLINDTKNDGKPYFLTANHCGDGSTTSDYAQWVFYFNYESSGCSRPATEPAIHSLSGAKLLAHVDYNQGSDFKLLLLNDSVPYTYKPFYNGWDRSGNISDSGVAIHHPQGDIKMISTYKTPVRPVDYYGTVTDPNANFWEVHWAATVSGHGVTEGGSSGSPLYNAKGLVIGTLTGGDAGCSTPDSPDYFGRFSKHWDGAGTDSTRQLAYWLDKAHTGLKEIPGYDPLSVHAVANFSSDVNKTPPDGFIRFTDLSTGPVTGYQWSFEGGDPESYSGKTPPPVRYKKTGTYRVQLKVTSAAGSSIKVDSVFVLPVIYPNPTRDGRIFILLGSYQPQDVSLSIFDLMGRKLNTFTPQFGNDHVIVQLPHNQNGMYIIRLAFNNTVHTYKIINIHK